MSENDKSPFDSHATITLYDIVDSNIDLDPREDGSLDYEGFHILPQGNGRYHVQLDGHVGTVMEFCDDEYDDVLELVADLNRLVTRRFEYDYQDDKEALVEWAGKIMTSDAERAEANPGLYVEVPDYV